MSILVDKNTKVLTQGMTGIPPQAWLQVSLDAVKELLVACKAIDGSLG